MKPTNAPRASAFAPVPATNPARRPALALALALALASPTSPLGGQVDYSGYTPEELAEKLLGGGQRERREAAYELARRGPSAAPAVPALAKALDDDEDQVWFQSVTALARIGPAAAAAVPELINDLESGGRYRRQRWYRTAFALGKIGQPAMPALRAALGAHSDDVRSGAAKAIGWIGPAALPAAADLVSALSDDESRVREEAAEALALLGPGAHPLILDALRSEDLKTRTGAADALAHAGPEAAAHAPVLIGHLEADPAPEPAFQARAIAALSRVGCPPGRLAPLLAAALSGGEPEVRAAAIDALLLLPDPGRHAVPLLVDLLGADGGGEETAQLAVHLLGRIGPGAGAAVPALLQRRESSPGPVTETLVEIGAPAIPALLAQLAGSGEDAGPPASHWVTEALRSMDASAAPPLAEALRSGETAVRVAAVSALATLAPKAIDRRPLIWALREVVDDRDPRVRTGALGALIAAGADPASLLPEMEGALRDPSPAVRAAAVETVVAMGEAARALAPPLIAALRDPEERVQIGATRALGALRPPPLDAVDPLRQALAQPGGDSLKKELVLALGAAGESAAPAVPQLAALLRDGPPDLRAAAATALGQVGPGAKKVFPDLVAAADGPGQPALRAAARLGSDARELAPQLFALLDHAELRHDAMGAIRAVRPREPGPYIAALDNDDPAVRAFACDALGYIRSPDAIPALQKRLQDPYDFIQRRAADAIRRIERRRR